MGSHKFYDLLLQMLEDEDIIFFDGAEIEHITIQKGSTDDKELYFQITGQMPVNESVKVPFQICAKACEGWRYTPDSKDCHHLTRVKHHTVNEQGIPAKTLEGHD